MREGAMKKWEYKVEKKGNEDQLNALGEQGWELVHVSYAFLKFYLKREKA